MSDADVNRARPFFVLGAMKCGTTSLYRYVDTHPDVFFSEPKEPIFFEAQYERGMDFYRERYFAGYAGEACAGEARTHNLGLPFVAERIHASLPDARLIAILRDPVDRAYSEWWHQHTRGVEPRSFEEAIEENRARRQAGERFEGEAGARAWQAGLFNDWSAESRYGLYLDLGHYAEALERYRALFDPAQLLVLLFEDLSRDPLAETRRVWRFLGVDADRALPDTAPRNPARTTVSSPAAAAWRRRLRALPGKDALRALTPAPLLRRWRGFIEGAPAERPPMRAATERLLLDYFEPHNRALERLLGRELPSWFAPRPARTGGAS